MNPLILLGSILILFVLLLLFLIAPGRSSKKQKNIFKNRSIAHRGLHNKTRTIPENSLAAFLAAKQKGYGIELDIQLSQDGQLVVFHDDTLLRVCGVNKYVDELSYEKLRELSLCQTQEYIPLFTEVLHLVNGSVPLIVELKHGKNNALLCEKCYNLLKEYHGEYCIESFHPGIVAWFYKNAPEILRGQLSGPISEFIGVLKPYEAFALSHLLCNFMTRPQFISYHKNKTYFLVKLCDLLGAMRVVWTVRDTDDIKKIESKNDTIIFEFYEPPVLFPSATSYHL